ncbi:MAG: sensor histidine kinase [Saprospiraceae bacterium]|nr:sensor histidine kinase [Bacteroidia bacterium]NNL90910.1 sensor histidine kinase [Saprospiraceae bacterium]
MKALLKNLSVKQISFYVTLLVWLIYLFFILVVFLIDGLPHVSLLSVVVYIVGSILISYLVIKYLFEKFVFRKIKLIYKFISKSKNSMSSVDENIGITLEEVNESVINWAEQREEEISELKLLENYRQNFVGDISHELKTPIFAIQGFLHTLLDGGMYDENINFKYLERAAKNTERLQLIVEDLELINNLQSESSQLEYSNFSIKKLASEVIEDFEILASEKNIKIFFKAGADQDFNVEADRDKTRQVFVNLISNSIKYGKENGQTKISFYDMEELILIEVSDDGIGVEDKHLKHLFDRFYRADKSRARQIGGSGLGLSIVKHIVEAHKQKITVRSTLGKGSTFGFTLKKSQ